MFDSMLVLGFLTAKRSFFLIHYSHATYLDHDEPGEDFWIEGRKRRLTSASPGPRSPKSRQELTKRPIQASGIQGAEHDAASLLKPLW
jgi:hypothetical protein